MKERTFDGMIAYFNCRVSEMDIAQDYKMELLGMVTALGYKHEKTTQHWIPCSERLPDLDEDGFSEKMLVSFSNFGGLEICNYRETDEEHGWYVGDSTEKPEDIGVHVIAWMPLPEPYRKEGKHD